MARAGDWERFRTVWHDDGRMMATWFQGSADEFIRVSREGWDRGVSILHFLGGSSIDVAGNRAIAQTKMTISQRGDVDGVRATSCAPAASTILRARDGRWGIVLRQPIYEKDRIDPIDPAAALVLDPELLDRFRKAIATSPTSRPGSATRQARHAGTQGRRGRGAVRAWPAVAAGRSAIVAPRNGARR